MSEDSEWADIDDSEPQTLETPSVPDDTSSAPTAGDDQIPQREPVPASESPQTGEGGGQPQEDAWPDDLLRLSGLNAEQARKHFASPDQLERALAWQDQQMLQAGKAGWGPPPPQPQPQQQFTPQQPPQPQPQLSAQDKLDLGLKPEEWDEQTIGLVNRINDHYHERFSHAVQRTAQLENALQTITQYMLNQAESEYVQQFDNMVNTLPETYQEVFGKGAKHEIDPKGPHFAARVRLNEAMSAIARGRQMNGLPPLTRDQLFQRALRAEFGQIEAKAIRQEIGKKLERRSRQFTARPSGRQGTPLSPDEKAAQRVGEILRSKGITMGADEPDESDGI